MCSDVNSGGPGIEQAEAAKPSIWRRMISAPEGKVLIAGVVLLCLYVVAVALARMKSRDLFQSLATMTTSHLLGGRAAGLTWGYKEGLPPYVVILVSMAIETVMVLVFYPLFVFSYSRLIVIKPLEDTLARARRAAEAHQATIMKFGIPGLLLFVWFPFWMTGPLIGCVIGFLIGLRPWANVSVVLAGTYLAILCWGVILHRVHDWLAGVGHYIPLVFVGFLLLLAVSIHIRYAFARTSNRSKQ